MGLARRIDRTKPQVPREADSEFEMLRHVEQVITYNNNCPRLHGNNVLSILANRQIQLHAWRSRRSSPFDLSRGLLILIALRTGGTFVVRGVIVASFHVCHLVTIDGK